MKKGSIHLSTFSIILSIGLLFFLFSQWSTLNQNDGGIKTVKEKQRGAHVFGRLDSTNLQALKQKNIEWITLVPFSDQKNYDSPTLVYYRGDSLQQLRRDSMWSSQIKLAHTYGFKIFIKPHIWIHEPSPGKWRSDIFPSNENNWNLWQKNYREFILFYAQIAERNKAEMFCIGAELSRLSVEKPDFWKDFIQEVRSIYSGKITYAANWYQEYENISFWEDLDYIGIQAYFPLVSSKYPTVQEVSKGWEQHLPTMDSIAQKYNRKILFTEMGYKSTANSAIKPWEWVDYSSENKFAVSDETQANCYEAFFKTVWEKEWFAGVHIWQLRSNFVKGRGKNNVDFTPQGKPAEQVISNAFKIE